MASGGDEGENPFQRTSATILNSEHDEANEDEKKQTNDNGKHQAPRSTCSNNQKINAIPEGEKQEVKSPTVVFQATENEAGPPGPVAINTSRTDIIVPSSTDEVNSPTVVFQATENEAGPPGPVAINSSRTDIIVPSSTDDIAVGLLAGQDILPIQSATSIIEAISAPFMSLYNRNNINTIRGPMQITDIPVMRSNDGGKSVNTCTIDSLLMILMVAILVYPVLSINLEASQNQNHIEVFQSLFLQMYLHNLMDQMRIYLFERLNWYTGGRDWWPDPLDFWVQDGQLIDPLIVNSAVPTKNLLETYYGSMRIRELSFDSLFNEEPRIWISRENREYGVGIVNSLTADDIQYCFDEYFRSLTTCTRNLNLRNCDPIVNIRYPDPFLLLEAGPLVISTQNIRNLLGSVIQVGNLEYQVSAYTVHRYEHYYSVIYLPEQNRSIIYDNNYGILKNHFSVYKLRELYHYYKNCRDCYNIDYPDETVSLILLVKIDRNDNNKKS